MSLKKHIGFYNQGYYPREILDSYGTTDGIRGKIVVNSNVRLFQNAGLAFQAFQNGDLRYGLFFPFSRSDEGLVKEVYKILLLPNLQFWIAGDYYYPSTSETGASHLGSSTRFLHIVPVPRRKRFPGSYISIKNKGNGDLKEKSDPYMATLVVRGRPDFSRVAQIILDHYFKIERVENIRNGSFACDMFMEIAASPLGFQIGVRAHVDNGHFKQFLQELINTNHKVDVIGCYKPQTVPVLQNGLVSFTL